MCLKAINASILYSKLVQPLGSLVDFKQSGVVFIIDLKNTVKIF